MNSTPACQTPQSQTPQSQTPQSYALFNGTDVKDVASVSYSMNPAELPVTPVVALGTGINRWESLFFDPQKNCIEPFPRIGMNTVLPVLDTQASSCFPTYLAQGSLQQDLKSSNDY